MIEEHSQWNLKHGKREKTDRGKQTRLRGIQTYFRNQIRSNNRIDDPKEI